MTKTDAILKLYPTVVTVRGNDAYDENEQIVAYDNTAVEAEVETNAYKEARAKAYPPTTDYLDGVVKGDQVQIDKYIADCLAVKAKYPKGTN
jgi:hypothetical protein